MPKSALFLASALIALVGFAPPARALPPQEEVFVDLGLFVLPDIDCGAFSLHEDLVSERIQITTFFDESGTATRQQWTVAFQGRITKSTTGQTYQDLVSGLDTFDLVTGESSFAGPGLRITVPGHGVVLLHTGRKVLDAQGNLVLNAGPDEFGKTLEEAFCGALA